MTMTEPYETEPRPTTYNEASGHDWDIVKAQARYRQLTERGLYARSRAALEARGEYDPAKHGTRFPEPLTASEHLELLANGEVLARYYWHPSMLDHAVKAGASWEQIGAARGTSAEQARQDYREWAEGQHNLWTGKWGGEPGRSGLDDAGYAAALARAHEPEPGAAKAYAATHRILCAHADDDGQGAHWLAPGEKCTRGQIPMEPDPAEAHGFGRNQPGPYDQEAGR
jgi:hypothetical protein